MENFLRFPDLRSMDLIDGLDPVRAEEFLQSCKLKSFKSDTPILSQGETADSFYIVASGAVEVSYDSPEGHRAILRLCRTPGILGLFECIAKQPCVANCVAMRGTEVLQCPNTALQEFLSDPIFVRNVARVACLILEHDNTYKAIDQFYSSEQRICRYLNKFAGETRIFCQNQSYLANIVGCTRQTVNKELSQLRERQVIAIEKGQITILNPEGLEDRIRELDDRARKRA